MMVGKAAGHLDRAAGLGNRIEEFLGIADAGEGKEAPAGKLPDITDLRVRLINRTPGARRHADDVVGRLALADLEDALREAHLVNQRRPHRTAGDDMAVTDAAA